MLEQQGIPTAAVCTADFLAGGRMQAESLHMPTYSPIGVPQDYITSTPNKVRDLAAAYLDEVLTRLLATG